MTQKTKETSAIKLQVISEIKNGKEVYSTVSFSGFNVALSDDDIMALGDGLASLQKHPLNAINRVDSCTLVEG